MPESGVFLGDLFEVGGGKGGGVLEGLAFGAAQLHHLHGVGEFGQDEWGVGTVDGELRELLREVFDARVGGGPFFGGGLVELVSSWLATDDGPEIGRAVVGGFTEDAIDVAEVAEELAGDVVLVMEDVGAEGNGEIEVFVGVETP